MPPSPDRPNPNPTPSPSHYQQTMPTPKTRSPRAPIRTHDGVIRRATSCNDRSNFMRHRVRSIASEWKRLGASAQVQSWIRRGVRILFIGVRRPPPFTSGACMLDATQQQLDFMDSELPRFMMSSA
jgi:hypothetical protein